MTEFLSGATMLGFAVAGLFFLRYHRQTRDRLFLMFGAAFFVLSVNRLAIQMNQADEVNTLFYVVRLVAFLLILLAILDKNRTTGRERAPER